MFYALWLYIKKLILRLEYKTSCPHAKLQRVFWRTGSSHSDVCMLLVCWSS